MLLMPFLHLTPKTHLAGNDYREGVIAQNAQFGINRWNDDEHLWSRSWDSTYRLTGSLVPQNNIVNIYRGLTSSATVL